MANRDRGRRTKEQAAPGPPCAAAAFSRAVARGLLTCAALLAILYGTLLAVSRTEGFASIVQRRLAHAFPADWRLSAVRISPALRLHLQDAEVRVDPEAESPALRAAEITLGPDLRRLLRARLSPGFVHVHGGTASFSESGTGWTPAPFSPLAALLFPAGGGVPSPFPPAAEGSGREIPAGWPRWRASASEWNVEWRDGQGTLLAAAHGLHVQSTPLAAPGRRLTHIRLEAAEWRAGPEAFVRNLWMEWLAVEHRSWILALESDPP